jgi:glycosyltransferase involved in cell wall biosynthesis
MQAAPQPAQQTEIAEVQSHVDCGCCAPRLDIQKNCATDPHGPPEDLHVKYEEEPYVSVLTPVYNGEAYLAECIESVLNQTYRNFEYIIVNNCSTDGTLAIAEKYALQDQRIKVVSNEKFLTVIDNHNNAFNRMSPDARYCKVVSGDDTIFPTCIAKMVELAEANPKVGIVGCYQVSGSVVRWLGHRYPQQVIPGREVCRQNLLERQELVQGQGVLGFGTPTSLLYRADLVRRTDAFYSNPSPHSDTSACFESLLDTDFGFVYEVLSYERTHEATQTTASRKSNRFLSANLNDLLNYGPKLLTPVEMKQQLSRILSEYHRYLAITFFMHSQGPEFWNYHRSRLKELGHPLKRFDLVKAAIILVAKEIVNPGHALQKIRTRMASSREERGQSAEKLKNQATKPSNALLS